MSTAFEVPAQQGQGLGRGPGVSPTLSLSLNASVCLLLLQQETQSQVNEDRCLRASGAVWGNGASAYDRWLHGSLSLLCLSVCLSMTRSKLNAFLWLVFLIKFASVTSGLTGPLTHSCLRAGCPPVQLFCHKNSDVAVTGRTTMCWFLANLSMNLARGGDM